MLFLRILFSLPVLFSYNVKWVYAISSTDALCKLALDFRSSAFREIDLSFDADLKKAGAELKARDTLTNHITLAESAVQYLQKKGISSEVECTPDYCLVYIIPSSPTTHWLVRNANSLKRKGFRLAFSTEAYRMDFAFTEERAGMVVYPWANLGTEFPTRSARHELKHIGTKLPRIRIYLTEEGWSQPNWKETPLDGEYNGDSHRIDEGSAYAWMVRDSIHFLSKILKHANEMFRNGQKVEALKLLLNGLSEIEYSRGNAQIARAFLESDIAVLKAAQIPGHRSRTLPRPEIHVGEIGVPNREIQILSKSKSVFAGTRLQYSSEEFKKGSVNSNLEAARSKLLDEVVRLIRSESKLGKTELSIHGTIDRVLAQISPEDLKQVIDETIRRIQVERKITGVNGLQFGLAKMTTRYLTLKGIPAVLYRSDGDGVSVRIIPYTHSKHWLSEMANSLMKAPLRISSILDPSELEYETLDVAQASDIVYVFPWKVLDELDLKTPSPRVLTGLIQFGSEDEDPIHFASLTVEFSSILDDFNALVAGKKKEIYDLRARVSDMQMDLSFSKKNVGAALEELQSPSPNIQSLLNGLNYRIGHKNRSIYLDLKTFQFGRPGVGIVPPFPKKEVFQTLELVKSKFEEMENSLHGIKKALSQLAGRSSKKLPPQLR